MTQKYKVVRRGYKRGNLLLPLHQNVSMTTTEPPNSDVASDIWGSSYCVQDHVKCAREDIQHTALEFQVQSQLLFSGGTSPSSGSVQGGQEGGTGGSGRGGIFV